MWIFFPKNIFHFQNGCHWLAKGWQPPLGQRRQWSAIFATNGPTLGQRRQILPTMPTLARRLCAIWEGYQASPTLGCDPITAQHGDFCLLHFCPGPICPSLDNLEALGSPWTTILMPSLMRTLDLHRTMSDRTPSLTPSINSGLPAAGLQDRANSPSHFRAVILSLIYHDIVYVVFCECVNLLLRTDKVASSKYVNKQFTIYEVWFVRSLW